MGHQATMLHRMNPILQSSTICSFLLVTVLGSFNVNDPDFLKQVHGWKITYTPRPGKSQVFHVTNRARYDYQAHGVKKGEPIPEWVGEYWTDWAGCNLHRPSGTWELNIPGATHLSCTAPDRKIPEKKRGTDRPKEEST